MQALDLFEKSAKLGYAPAMVNKAYLLHKQAEEAERETDYLKAQDLFFDCANWLRLALSHK